MMKSKRVASWALVGAILLISNIVVAAEFSYTLENNSADITIRGEIMDGDYDKFIEMANKAFTETTASYEYVMMQLKKNDIKKYKEINTKTSNIGGASRVTIFLNSNGGSVTEAIKIGEAIHEMAMRTAMPDKNATCASACFFIWVGGVERIAFTSNEKSGIGIHRVYFDSSKYKNLTSSDAEQEYKMAQDMSVNYLHKMGVPQELINKAISIPSNDVYYLSLEEIDGIDDYVPYLDELLTARCGNYNKEEWDDYLECVVIYSEIDDGKYSYLQKNYLRKKCDSLSTGYKDYLERSIGDIRQCKRMYSEIECWKRMAAYLGYSHLIPK